MEVINIFKWLGLVVVYYLIIGVIISTTLVAANKLAPAEGIPPGESWLFGVVGWPIVMTLSLIGNK